MVLLECITSSTDLLKSLVQLLNKTGIPPCYKKECKSSEKSEREGDLVGVIQSLCTSRYLKWAALPFQIQSTKAVLSSQLFSKTRSVGRARIQNRNLQFFSRHTYKSYIHNITYTQSHALFDFAGLRSGGQRLMWIALTILS